MGFEDFFLGHVPLSVGAVRIFDFLFQWLVEPVAHDCKHVLVVLVQPLTLGTGQIEVEESILFARRQQLREFLRVALNELVESNGR